MEQSNVDLDCCRTVLVFREREKSQRQFIAVEMIAVEMMEPKIPCPAPLPVATAPSTPSARIFYQQQEIITTTSKSF